MYMYCTCKNTDEKSTTTYSGRKTKQHTHKVLSGCTSRLSQASPFSPVFPETWASPLFFPSALIPYLVSAAGTEVVFIFTRTHIARISLRLSDWFQLQYVTNEWVYESFFCHTGNKELWQARSHFIDNFKGTRPRRRHHRRRCRGNVRTICYIATKQEEGVAPSKRSVRKPRFPGDGRWLLKWKAKIWGKNYEKCCGCLQFWRSAVLNPTPTVLSFRGREIFESQTDQDALHVTVFLYNIHITYIFNPRQHG